MVLIEKTDDALKEASQSKDSWAKKLDGFGF